MAYVPRTDGVRLSRVSAVEPGYPFYGRIRTDPASAWAGLADGANIVVDSSLLGALSAQVGDTVVLGKTRFRISAAATDIPGNVGARAAFGPQVFIAARWLDSTGLITAGSLVTRRVYVRLGPGTETETVARRIRDALSGDRITVRTVVEDREDLQDALEQMGRYLGLVALVALLLGGLGVASAVHVFIRRKIDTIAVLRCLGADGRQLVGTYLVQALSMGLAGSLLGAGLGVGLQMLLPRLFAGLIPVDVEVTPAWGAIATGVGTGLWVSGMFALLPLLGIRRVSPLVVLRRDFDSGIPRRRDPLRWPVGLLLVLSIAGMAALQVENIGSGLAFTAGIGLVLGVLALAALALVRGLRRWFPSGLPYLWRQGLANLYRPANQTTMVVLALGFGAFLLSTLYLVQRNLLTRFQVDATGSRPNLVLWDIQPGQKDPIERMLRDSGYAPTSPVPIVPMRIASVKGRPVADLLKDTALVDDSGERLGHWAIRREYRSTYRDTTVGSEKVVVGDWWPAAGTPDRAYDGVAPISLETDVAGELGVTLGDTIVWDVQGVEVATRVQSLRNVNWARFEPNFFAVFPGGVLERAPQSFVTLARVDDPVARGRLQRRIAERYSNVTALDLSQLIHSLEELVDRVILVVRFMAIFSLAAGAVVLAGAVATSRLQRIREGVLLRTLGATRGQVLRIFTAEYLTLGALSVLIAIGLSAIAGWALMRFVFELPFRFPTLPLAGLALAVLVLTLMVGFVVSRETFRRTPLELLRTE